MAEKYSDFIKTQNFLPVYDMLDESQNPWYSFIPTKQFCDLLRRSVTAITSSEPSKRRSMWVRGTFGTGKSHASSVIRHLLCDEPQEISDYISNINDDQLRASLNAVRKKKRYFPVILKGVEGAYNIPRFALSIQRATKEALINAGHSDIVVTSDFDRAVRWVEGHRTRIPELLDVSDELASLVSSTDKLISKLQQHNIDVFLQLEEVLAVDDTYLSTTSISDWLVEVSNAIQEKGIANGLIIFWDEFTSVMDTLKSDRINVLQNIAEKSQNNNVFLFLISHRTESTSLDAKGKDITKMSDRYDNVDYFMDEISTYLIMRHTFNIQDEQRMNMVTFDMRRAVDKTLYDYLCENKSDEEKSYIQSLFPLHPYTAFLCSKMSNIMGSANRSVLRFMNDEERGFKQFINNPTNYEQKMMLTADWLWDFFYSEFLSDPLCAAFTNVFGSSQSKVDKMGDDYMRVFKVILLLNALTVKFKSSQDKYAPNEQNIKFIFSGDRVSKKLKAILDWLDETKIIARDIFGDFKISVSNYNPAEIAKQKTTVSLQYKTAVDYLKYSVDSQSELLRLFLVGDRLMRKCDPQFYGCEEQEAVLRSKLNKYTREKPNHLHVAVFFAISDESRDMIEHRVQDFSSEFDDTLFIIPVEVLTSTAKNQFIDAVAQANVSRAHFNNDDASQFENTAKEYIVKWKNRLNGGTYALYFKGNRYSEGIFSNINQAINKKFSVQIFPQGMESVKALHNESMTFFANKNFKAVSLQMLQKRTRDELLNFSGSLRGPAKHLFMDGTNNLLTETCELTPKAAEGSSWIVQICKEVDFLIESAKKKYADRFSLSDILAPLMRPPYGMFANPSNYIAISFALRKHKDDLFNPSTSQPVGDEKLNDMIQILLQMWDGGTSEPSNKLLLRFGSVEERQLTSLLGEVFNLSSVKGVSMSDLKSLNYAKWSIGEFCKQVAKYPLWSLLYCSKIDSQPNSRKCIEDLINLFNAETYALSKVKELFNEMHREQVPLYRLLTNAGNYREGFVAFIKQLDDVELKDEWWDELEEDLSHMQSEIAFRKEVDVEKYVQSFYIRKLKPQTVQHKTVILHADSTVVAEDIQDNNNVIQVPVPSEDEVRKARNIVRGLNMPSMMWQQVVLDILDKHPEVSSLLVKNLSK